MVTWGTRFLVESLQNTKSGKKLASTAHGSSGLPVLSGFFATTPEATNIRQIKAVAETSHLYGNEFMIFSFGRRHRPPIKFAARSD
jgi:hypothetical protein